MAAAADENILKPSLQAKFEGIIWKIETDETNTQIAVETRDPEKKLIRFSVFNYQNGQSLLNDVDSENGWWNLDRLHHNLLYLHGYIRTSSPEHKGIQAIDVHTGQTRWQHFQLSLEDISNDGLIAYNPDLYPKKLKLLDSQTGQTIQQDIKSFIPVSRHIIFPETVSNRELLPEFIPANIAGPVLYLKYHEKECWSFHAVNQSVYTQYLIIAANKHLILKDVLAVGIQKLNPEAFFLQQNYLFCVRDNNREIVSYLL